MLKLSTIIDIMTMNLLWPALTPILIFLVFWFVILFVIEEGVYALDPKDVGSKKGRGIFEPHNRNYLEVAKLVIGLGSASIGALAIFFFRNDSYVKGLQAHIKWPLIFFAATVVFGVAFVGALVWRYEKYCHDSGSYTHRWYAFIAALGATMLFCLAAGYSSFTLILLL